MIISFKAFSISYKTAPVEVREKISLSEGECRRLLVRLQEVLGLPEALIVSTCNRTEVYYSSEEDLTAAIVGLLAIEKGLEGSAQHWLQYVEVLNTHEEAVRQLFRVAVGLESQVVGDLQISHQVKNAYQWSADAGMAGAFLHRLLHTIFFTNKKVVQETAFRDGAASVSYAAVEMIEELAANLAQPRILVVGVGEIGADVVRNLRNTPFTDVTITNRTFPKAADLAAETGFAVAPFEQAHSLIAQADVIISSVAMATPFITEAHFADKDRFSFKYLFDLSMPRSIEPSVENLPGVLLYNVDSINNRANEAIARRKAAIPDVERIVEEALSDFNNWSREMIVSPVIHKLKNLLDQIRREEIARYTKQLDAEEMEKIDKITRGIMQKIIKMPVLQLKAACKRGEAENLVDVLNDLFNLEQQEQPFDHQA
jgi:glutamyl-tRNA reductase